MSGWLERARAPARGALERWVNYLWYRRNHFFWLLLPMSGLYGALVALRREAYRRGWYPTQRLPAPVVVVGNIAVGGSGKTPLVAWMVQVLRDAGWHPGIVSRGYGGAASFWPQQVRADSDPQVVGDEPVMLARQCGCPVVVDPRRARGGQALLDHAGCDLVICDDGLQHLALTPDIKVAVVDGQRRFGNGCLLPAGPLRERVPRLHEVDFVVVKAAPGDRVADAEFAMYLRQGVLINLDSGAQALPEDFAGRQVHAIAGIGNPESFFSRLRAAGMGVDARAYPDHHRYRPRDLAFADRRPVLMTAKDAVKCLPLLQASGGGSALSRCWYLDYQVEVEGGLARQLLQRLAVAPRRQDRGDMDGQEIAGDSGVPGEQGSAGL